MFYDYHKMDYLLKYCIGFLKCLLNVENIKCIYKGPYKSHGESHGLLVGILHMHTTIFGINTIKFS